MSKPLIVDLHIHSHFSRATSKEMNISSLYRWGKIKGINVIGTGDFTHPGWVSELQQKLEPAEPGLFRLKEEFAHKEDELLPSSCKDNLIRFILSVEISNIYSRHERVRKLHNLIVVPDFVTAIKINAKLDKIGNIKHDGRPILGMDSYDLLKLSLDSNPDNIDSENIDELRQTIKNHRLDEDETPEPFSSITKRFSDIVSQIPFSELKNRIIGLPQTHRAVILHRLGYNAPENIEVAGKTISFSDRNIPAGIFVSHVILDYFERDKHKYYKILQEATELISGNI